HQPMPALSYFFRVLIVGRDAGETEELIKIFEMTCAHGWTVATQKRLSSQGRPLPSPKLSLSGKTHSLFEPVCAMTIERSFAFARDDSSASMNTWSYRSVPLLFVSS